MGIGRFFRDVICAPYSIPIGLINYNVKTLGMCSETTKKELDIKDATEHDKVYTGETGTAREDITSMSDYSVLNQAIQDILTDAANFETRTIIATTAFNKKCPPILSLEDDPNADYTRWLYNLGTTKLGNDGKLYELPLFGCCPDVEQTTNITVITFDNITEDHYEQIYNEIEMHVENSLTETGAERSANVNMSVLSSMNIKNVLKQQVRNEIKNQTDQNINVDLTLDYTDRYGRCEYEMDQHGKWWSKNKLLKQTIDIEVLTKNIINTSMKLVMKNINTVDSKTSTTVNRITNHRIIVVSLLWDVIVIFLLFKLFGAFLRKIN